MSDLAAPNAVLAREAALCAFLPLARQIARRAAAGLPRAMEPEDVLGYAAVGLVEAFARYDAARGVPFGAYAARRIRGAVIDAHRSLDPLSRPARARARLFEEARAQLRAELGREPAQGELAHATGSPVAALAAATAPEERSLEAVQAAPGAWEPAAPGPSPEEAALRAHLHASVARAVAALPPREQLVVSLYYREELSMNEIARVLALSQARVSQLHARALRRLRQALDAWS